jgi:hypothetical protein
MSDVGKPVPGKLSAWLKQFGYRQVPVWYATSQETIDEFDTIGKKLRILRFIPNPFPFYDWIMGFYERPSDREALAATSTRSSSPRSTAAGWPGRSRSSTRTAS